MSTHTLLLVDGEVDNPLRLNFDDLLHVEKAFQIQDVSRIDPARRGDAVTLVGLLTLAQARPKARYLGLHSSTDNFHASIPLEPVRDRAFLIYRVDGEPLSEQAGGPLRFFIPDFAACHTDEIDECANVKFVDHIELTAKKGLDTRPQDEDEHERLHRE